MNKELKEISARLEELADKCLSPKAQDLLIEASTKIDWATKYEN